jgi:hypothetical protein
MHTKRSTQSEESGRSDGTGSPATSTHGRSPAEQSPLGRCAAWCYGRRRLLLALWMVVAIGRGLLAVPVQRALMYSTSSSRSFSSSPIRHFTTSPILTMPRRMPSSTTGT